MNECKLVPVELLDRFPEINPSNYGPDDVDALNAWGIELVLAAAPVQPSPAEPLDREAIRNEVLEEGIAELKLYASYISNVDIRTGAMVAVDKLCALKSQPAQPSDSDVLWWMHRGGLIDIPSCREAMRKYPDGLNGEAAQPSDSQADVSDTEMLDFIERVGCSLRRWPISTGGYEWDAYWKNDAGSTEFAGGHSSARAAVKAAMQTEQSTK